MKRIALTLATLVFPLALTLPGQEVERRGGTGPEMIPEGTGNPTVEATTDAEFIKRSAAQGSPVPSGKPLPMAAHPYSLMAMSCFLESNGKAVILPKGCILHRTPSLAISCPEKPASQPVSWQEFLAANRALVRCLEVTEDQVRGAVPIPPEALDLKGKPEAVVIATLRGNPVTVLTPKAPAP
ncbi:MAG: hypothetical protein EOP88_25895 [Verrucomicrobiaceae bacterium]|nr:MAG: hypothetical protein EOP88_25895 [Verrucomicrobiaceae bacterium]